MTTKPSPAHLGEYDEHQAQVQAQATAAAFQVAALTSSIAAALRRPLTLDFGHVREQLDQAERAQRTARAALRAMAVAKIDSRGPDAMVKITVPPAPGSAELAQAYVELMQVHALAVDVIDAFGITGDWPLAEAGQIIVDEACTAALSALRGARRQMGFVAAAGPKRAGG